MLIKSQKLQIYQTNLLPKPKTLNKTLMSKKAATCKMITLCKHPDAAVASLVSLCY